MSRSKYGVSDKRKRMANGILFDSKLEMTRYLVLLDKTYKAEISHLSLQPIFVLAPSFTDKYGKHHRAITFVADFKYTIVATGEEIIEDTKGFRTAVFRLKEKLFRRKFPKLSLVIITADNIGS